MADDILLNIQDRVATVTFNRPTQRNAISYEGWLKLQDILTMLENQKEVAIVVLTGAGKDAFSAGADIKDFEKHRQNSDDAKIYASAFDGAMDTLEAMSKPTICLIKGFCIGGGCELSMAAEIRNSCCKTWNTGRVPGNE
jgi:enoyl-CoA hydratase/carnithine racemase